MKFKALLILFIVAVLLTIAGAFFKLMHWPYGQFILTVAMLVQALAIILLIVKLISNKNTRDLNK